MNNQQTQQQRKENRKARDADRRGKARAKQAMGFTMDALITPDMVASLRQAVRE